MGRRKNALLSTNALAFGGGLVIWALREALGAADADYSFFAFVSACSAIPVYVFNFALIILVNLLARCANVIFVVGRRQFWAG